MLCRRRSLSPVADRLYHLHREAEHRARQRVSLVSRIERDVDAAGLGPARREDRDAHTIAILTAAGELVATVGPARREHWADGNGDPAPIVATLPDRRPWLPGELWQRFGTRPAA